MTLSRETIESELKRIFREKFEIDDPAMDEDLRQAYDFDSIDAIELLVEIERMLGVSLSQEEKKQAMTIRTLADIRRYIEARDRKEA